MSYLNAHFAGNSEIGELLIERLPNVRGKLRSHVSLARRSWLRVGGEAEVLFQPADREDLIHFLVQCPADIPITLIGMTSNLLIRDAGIPGVVIKLGRAFTQVFISNTTVHVGAGALDSTVAQICCEAGIAGMEFLAGIPGTIGGAIHMNAGAFGSELKDILIEVHALSRTGQLLILRPPDLGFGYRSCQAASDLIFVSAILSGYRDDPFTIAKQIDTLTQKRLTCQPTRGHTAGCTFINPPGVRAWELIDQAGCRGLTDDDAQVQVSNQHCNFLINIKNAKAKAIEQLGETVREHVFKASGIRLNWEIKRIGQST